MSKKETAKNILEISIGIGIGEFGEKNGVL